MRKLLIVGALCMALAACNTAKGLIEDVNIGCQLAGPVGAIVAMPIPIAGAALMGACAADAVAKAGIDAVGAASK